MKGNARNLQAVSGNHSQAGELNAVEGRRVEIPFLQPLGLQHDPFPVVPDANNLFMPPRLEQLLSDTLHTIETRRGFIVTIGEVGLGKSTFGRRLLRELHQRGIQTALIINALLQGVELLDQINKDFGVVVEHKEMQAELEALYGFLLQHYREGSNCAIIIDDAQTLTVESLELVRQISNLETASDKLVQILLIGQPELEERLERFDLRQLNTRIALKLRFEHYSRIEIREYIQFKLHRAGDAGQIQLDNAIFGLIERFTDGCPRRINILMNRCLYGLIAYRTTTLTPHIVKQAARELNYLGRAASPVINMLVLAAVLSLLAVGGYALYRTGMQGLHVVDHASNESDQTITKPALSPTLELIPPSLVNRAREAQITGQLAEVALEIYAESGLLPMVLRAYPVWLERHYTLFPLGTTDTESRLLFWRPTYLLSNPLPQEANEGVRALQRDLRQAGYYQGEIDGIAGSMTRKSISEFRLNHSLGEGDGLDILTLFLLQQPSASEGDAK